MMIKYKYLMQAIFNEPIIRNFLSNINKEDHPSTIRELMMIGINVVNTKLHANLPQKENIHENYTSHEQNLEVVKELQMMKNRIDELSQLILRRSGRRDMEETVNNRKTITFKDENQNCKVIKMNDIAEEDLQKKDIKITPKVTETIPPEDPDSFQPPRHRCRSRHHLDDSQVRKVLSNPYVKQSPPPQPKSKKLDKKYEYQQQINQQQLRMIKSNHCEEENVINRSRRSKTGNNQYHVKSKIKNLIAQDKFKYKKTHVPEYDFNKYEYSDDQSQYQMHEEVNEQSESRMEQSSQQNYDYSSFKETKNVKKQEFDVVSNSSSFSKFSLGSQREAGKISNRKRRE